MMTASELRARKPAARQLEPAEVSYQYENMLHSPVPGICRSHPDAAGQTAAFVEAKHAQ